MWLETSRVGDWLGVMVLAWAGVASAAMPSYEQWRSAHSTQATAFEQRLKADGIQHVPPGHQLFRTASDWRFCLQQKGTEFAVPPESHWEFAVKTFQLRDELINRGLLARNAEIASTYRPANMATCAKSTTGSSHTRKHAYAIDLVGSGHTAAALCTFYKQEGARWRMGLSRYDSGRIHIDVTGQRTWGNDCTCETSYCQPCRKSTSRKCKR